MPGADVAQIVADPIAASIAARPIEIQEGSKHFDPKKQASDNAKNNNCRTLPILL
jgi:hypothetical protein